ncbi:hypothetical protein GCM10011586_19000 [Silvibacterium dinghuense]|nr:hypothetical protein GCM10011586_19000 [Silvibacterium dinghuense]
MRIVIPTGVSRKANVAEEPAVFSGTGKTAGPSTPLRSGRDDNDKGKFFIFRSSIWEYALDIYPEKHQAPHACGAWCGLDSV